MMHEKTSMTLRAWMKDEFQEARDLSKSDAPYIVKAEDDRAEVLIGTMGVLAVGHTLTMADKIVIIEPQHKPSTEQQAAKRALRIGQKLKVIVRRFCCSDSEGVDIEDTILAKGEFRVFFTQAAFEAETLRDGDTEDRSKIID